MSANPEVLTGCLVDVVCEIRETPVQVGNPFASRDLRVALIPTGVLFTSVIPRRCGRLTHIPLYVFY